MNTKKEHGKIDWMITLVPLAIVIALCVLFFFAPEQSNAVLSKIRFFFGDTFGTYYLVIGLGIFILSLYIAGSKYGNIVLGELNEKPNYSMGMQVTGKADFIAQYLESGDLYGMIVSIIKTMPCAHVIMVVVLLTMIAFYATSFDSIALTASCYSYHRLGDNEQPNKGIQLMWCILLILLPIALLFAESSMNNLQSVSIVAAFPIGAVIVMIAVSFMKDAKKYMENLEKSAKEKGEK